MRTADICVGLAAHVDAGKTTLAESILYKAGAIRKAGRVDHGDSVFDRLREERSRGITIFAKEAPFSLGGKDYTLMDTPGHEDLTGELMRALSVMDCCILVISAPRGIEEHDRKLWRLIEEAGVPAVIFVNKMDLPGADRAGILRLLKEELSDAVTDLALHAGDTEAASGHTVFSVMDCSGGPRDGFAGEPAPGVLEEIAVLDEELMERYLSGQGIGMDDLKGLFMARKLFPCCFGSALRHEGTDGLLDIISMLTDCRDCTESFGARVFRISHDAGGRKIAHIRLEGGCLRPRDEIAVHTARESTRPDREDGRTRDSKAKADQILTADLKSLRQTDLVCAGMTAAVYGLDAVSAGDGLGEVDAHIFAYDELFEEGRADEDPWKDPSAAWTRHGAAAGRRGGSGRKVIEHSGFGGDIHSLYLRLVPLYEEMPETSLSFDHESNVIRLRFTGILQQEIFAALAKERYGAELIFRDAGDFDEEIRQRKLEEERLLYESLYAADGEETAADAAGDESASVTSSHAAPEGTDYLGEGLRRDRELEAIFLSTAGRNANSGKQKPDRSSHARRLMEETRRLKREMPFVEVPDPGEHYVIVDGYNIIFAWDDLRELAGVSLDAARGMLSDMLSNYQGYRGMTLILVFDAYRVSGGTGSAGKYHNIYIVYTREAQTADAYIEQTVHKIAGSRRITVVTNDSLEQSMVFGDGAARMTASELRSDMDSCSLEIYRSFLRCSSEFRNRIKI